MPSLCGITLSVVTLASSIKPGTKTVPNFGIFPEFPHPDCVNTIPQGPSGKENFDDFLAEPPAKTRLDQLFAKRNTTSVYIPSAPCTRFWIRYRILSRAAKSKYYFFKLLMNGREITSWGCNAEKQNDGEITQALFDPVATEENCYRDDATGIIYKKMGLERRALLFKDVDDKIEGQVSAAADGGLFEVRVYRSSNRARRVQDPAIYKSQEAYGINLEAGQQLLKDPHLAKCYDYLLLDPLPEPHAVFKFHYRSWESLMSLNLVSEDHDCKFLPMTPSLWDLFGCSKAMEKELAQHRFDRFDSEEARITAAKVPLTRESLSTVPVSMSPRDKLRSRSWGELRSNDSDGGDSFLTAQTECFQESQYIDRSEDDGETLEHTDNDDKVAREQASETQATSLGDETAGEVDTYHEHSSDAISEEEGDDKSDPDRTSKAKKLAPRPSTPYAKVYDSVELEKPAVEPMPQNGLVARARSFFGSDTADRAKKRAEARTTAENTSKRLTATPISSLADAFNEKPFKRSPVRGHSPVRRITADDVPDLDPPKGIKDLHPNVIGWLNDSSTPGPPETGLLDNMTLEPRDLPPTPEPDPFRPLPVLPPRGSSSHTLRRTTAGLFRSASARDSTTHVGSQNNSLCNSEAQWLANRNLNVHGRRRADSLDNTITQQPTTELSHKPSTTFSELAQSSTASIPIMLHPDDIPIQSIESDELFEHLKIPTSKFNTISTLAVEKELPAVPMSLVTGSVTSNSDVAPESKKQKRGLRSSLNVFAMVGRTPKKERRSRSPSRG